jgi:Uma2 family endonuclease
MDQPLRPAKPATYADLAALPESVKGEILDGTLYTQPRPRSHHTWAQSMAFRDLSVLFTRRREDPGGWWLVCEPGIQVARSPEFSPDAAGWRKTRMPRLPKLRDPYRVVPDWILEVLSASNRRYDLTTKRSFYAGIGVEHLWYLDPEHRTLTVSRLHEGRWLELGIFCDDDKVRAEPFEEAELELGEWWPPVVEDE